LQRPIRTTRYKPEHIAEFLQDDWYQRFFAPLRGINPLHLRRAAAIHLCQIAAGGSVANAAQFLGIPAASAQQSVRRQRAWATNSPDIRQFETALHKLADELDSAPHLIDYKRRREALSRWRIDPDTWNLLATRHGVTAAFATKGESGDRQRQVAWARITQGEHQLAPRPICERLPPASSLAGSAASTHQSLSHKQFKPHIMSLISKPRSTPTPTRLPGASTAGKTPKSGLMPDYRIAGYCCTCSAGRSATPSPIAGLSPMEPHCARRRADSEEHP
jgi:hypothetical protein